MGVLHNDENLHPIIFEQIRALLCKFYNVADWFFVYRCSSKRLVAARGSFTFSLDQRRSATAAARGQVRGTRLTASTNSPHMQASPPIT